VNVRCVLVLGAGLLGCGPVDAHSALRGREGALWRYALDAPLKRWALPADLREISGLAVIADDRLLGHGDERAEVYEVDPARARAVPRFAMGHPAASGDFEGIAAADGRVWLVTSTGQLYEARLGSAGEAVQYQVHETGLGRRCELEGLTFDPVRRALLLPCKVPHDRRLRGALVVFAWSLDSAAIEAAPRFRVPIAALAGVRGVFRATAIERHPDGTFFVLSSTGDLVEIDASGAVLAVRRLGGRHAQPEGLGVTRDGLLYVADEGRPAALTIYGYAR